MREYREYRADLLRNGINTLRHQLMVLKEEMLQYVDSIDLDQPGTDMHDDAETLIRMLTEFRARAGELFATEDELKGLK